MDKSMGLPFKVQEYVPPMAQEIKKHISPHSTPASPGKRRNKGATEKVIRVMRSYLSGRWQADEAGHFWRISDTSASLGSDDSLTISVYNKTILRIEKNEGLVARICVFDGGRYDLDGNPAPITRERLNGLLDALSELRYLPDNVKVIMDSEYGLCYLARFGQKAALNKKYHNRIDVQRNPDKFVIERIHTPEGKLI